MQSKLSFLVRVDAHAEIGTGHLMRCLALAQELKVLGHSVIFLAAQINQELSARLHEEGFLLELQAASLPGSQEDAALTATYAKKLSAAWIIVDGYQFGAEFQATLKASGKRVLFFDDFGHAKSYPADLILNQNIYAKKDYYKVIGAHTELLLGVRYALLRNEFQKYIGIQKTISTSLQNILVTFGGVDAPNCSLQVLEALDKITDRVLQIQVISGSHNPHSAALEAMRKKSRHQITLTQNVQDITPFMAAADIAFTAGGSTCWELCFMGVPMLTMTIADNQIPTTAALEAGGVSIHLGWYYEASEQKIREAFMRLNQMTTREVKAKISQNLIDGRGRERVAEAMLQKVP